MSNTVTSTEQSIFTLKSLIAESEQSIRYAEENIERLEHDIASTKVAIAQNKGRKEAYAATLAFTKNRLEAIEKTMEAEREAFRKEEEDKQKARDIADPVLSAPPVCMRSSELQGILNDVNGRHRQTSHYAGKIQVIKSIREKFGTGLAETKHFVDRYVDEREGKVVFA